MSSTRRARRPAPRFVAVVLEPVDESDDERYAVADRGELLFYANGRRCFRLAAYLNRLDPSDAQLDVLLGAGVHADLLMQTITLRADATCHRCGFQIPAGREARWHSETRLVRHLRRCPRPAITTQRKRAA